MIGRIRCNGRWGASPLTDEEWADPRYSAYFLAEWGRFQCQCGQHHRREWRIRADNQPLPIWR